VTTNILIYSMAAFAVTLLGGVLPKAFRMLWEKPDKINQWRLLAFGSGALLGTSFLHLLPGGWQIAPGWVGSGALFAFLVLLAVEGFAMVHACSEVLEDCQVHTLSPVAFGAFAIHGVIDGLSITVGFAGGVGASVSLAIVVHKLADGLMLSSMLMMKDFSSKKSWVALVAIGFSTLLGAVAGLAFLPKLPNEMLAGMMGFTAGVFVYIGAADILPRLHRIRDRLSWVLFGLGVLAVSWIGG